MTEKYLLHKQKDMADAQSSKKPKTLIPKQKKIILEEGWEKGGKT